MTDRKDFISRQQFMAELDRYRKGSVTRRHFLGVTGLGLATSVLGAAVPGLRRAAECPARANCSARKQALQIALRKAICLCNSATRRLCAKSFSCMRHASPGRYQKG